MISPQISHRISSNTLPGSASTLSCLVEGALPGSIQWNTKGASPPGNIENTATRATPRISRQTAYSAGRERSRGQPGRPSEGRPECSGLRRAGEDVLGRVRPRQAQRVCLLRARQRGGLVSFRIYPLRLWIPFKSPLSPSGHPPQPQQPHRGRPSPPPLVLDPVAISAFHDIRRNVPLPPQPRIYHLSRAPLSPDPTFSSRSHTLHLCLSYAAVLERILLISAFPPLTTLTTPDSPDTNLTTFKYPHVLPPWRRAATDPVAGA